MLSLALLIAVSPKAAIALLILEYTTLFLLRVFLKNWRMYRAGADTVSFSLLAHFGWYVCLLSAPFPLGRNAAILSPSVYGFGFVYMLLANFLIVFVCFNYWDARNVIDQHVALAGLSLTTSATLISGAISFYLVPSTHRHTFYRHRSFSHHVKTFIWDEQSFTFDHNFNEITKRDHIRALIPTWCSLHYAPKELLKKLYEDKWKEWEETKPIWFDETFVSMLPPEVIPRRQHQEQDQSLSPPPR